MGDHQRKQTTDETIARLAAKQHGVVARWQLLRCRLSPDAIDRRLRGAWLTPIHRGVYAVGPVRSPRVREMAAVLACGEGAVLSYWSAAEVWELIPRDDRALDVSATAGSRGRHLPIRIHRAYSLRPDEVTTRAGLPVTTVVRTLYDLAAVADVDDVERALADSLARRLTDRAGLLSAVDRYAGRRGARRVRFLLDAGRGVARTRSEAEARFVRLIRRARLRAPETNTLVAGYEVDFYWRSERLVVEVDGKAFHSSADSFERDRRRDAVLMAAGNRVMRVTWRQIVKEPEALLVRLTRVLGGDGKPDRSHR